MKKLFTLAAAVLAAFCVNAADVTIALSSMTAGSNSYAYDGSEVKCKDNKIYIELPENQVQGNFTMYGSSDKSDRYLYIYSEGGTQKDETRAIQMKNAGVTIAYTASDIIVVANKPYLLFSTSHDFKFKKFSYTYEIAKTIVSTVETLTNAKINGEALDPNFLSELIDTKSVEVFYAYTTAPTVTFTKHVVITYDDESTKQSDVDVEVVAEALGSNQWTANITLNGADAYSITMQRAAAYTVTYKEGEQVLGTEVVAANSNPKEYAQYESLPLSTFEGWYKDAELTQAVASMAAEVISADVTFYAKFSKAYATSVNIEQWILDNGKDNAAFKTVLENAHFYYENINDLDSLNDLEKKDRNEPYLGLKIKKNGGYIACNVLPGTTIRIKFGYVAETVLAIAGNDTMRLAPTNNKIADMVFPIQVETLVKLQTTSDKTVVIKQIMINDTIKDVELPEQTVFPINITAENGKVTTAWEGKGEKHISAPAGITVTLTFTPDKGYEFDGVTLDGEPLQAVDSVYSFVMPAKAVAVVATFKQSTTAIDNTDATTKAVKVLRDGVLFIEKNGVRYNAQGAVVR